MGLIDDLGYRYPKANAVRKTVQNVASSKPGAWFFSKTLHHLDRAVSALTGGRTSLTEVLGGTPVIDVTTTGAKSGLPRTTQLLGIPVGGNLAILGTGFGQRPTPGWVYNLRADPRASVTYRNKTVDVMARPPTEEEAAEIWATAERLYGGYAKYPTRASHRDIAVFVLEPS